jgi:biopolymer transport protein ExbB
VTLMQPLFANVVFDFFLRGGPIMWPILFCLVAALVVVVERSLWWWKLSQRSQTAPLNDAFAAISQGEFEQATQLTNRPENPFLSTVHEGLLHAHTSFPRGDAIARHGRH